jgi:hypothetical protein
MAKNKNRRCGQRGLVKYPTQLDAQIALSAIHSRNARNNHRPFREEPTETFHCQFCGCHHLGVGSKVSV